MNYWKIKLGGGAVWKQQMPFDFDEEVREEYFEYYTYAITEEGSPRDDQYNKEFKNNLPF